MKFIWNANQGGDAITPDGEFLSKKPGTAAVQSESAESAQDRRDVLREDPALVQLAHEIKVLENTHGVKLDLQKTKVKNTLNLFRSTFDVSLKIRNAASEEERSFYISQLRSAEKSPEFDRFKKHALMVMQYLKPEPAEGPGVYRFEPGSQEVDDYVGAGDIFSAEVQGIRIKRAGENKFSEVATRSIRPDRQGRPRIGYRFPDGSYAAIREGDLVMPVDVRPATDPTVKRAIEDEQKILAEAQKKPEPKVVTSKTEEETAGYIQPLAPPEKRNEKTPKEPDKKILATALRYKNRPTPELETTEVANGRLACAKFTTMVLKEAGLIDELQINALRTTEVLQEKYGWKRVEAPPRPADVVLLERLPGGSHEHIVIATGPTTMMHKSSNFRTPVEQPFTKGRGMLLILRHPATRSSSSNSRKKELEPVRKGGSEFTKEEQKAWKDLSYDQILQLVEDRNPGFLNKVRDIAGNVGCSPDVILAIMWKESRLRPWIQNPTSTRATGLIQFTAETARNYGTSVEQLVNMTANEQLVYVEKFFHQYYGKNRIHDFPDVYLAVFYPAALGKPDDYILGSEAKPTKKHPNRTPAVVMKQVFDYNPGIAPKDQGYITVGDFRKYAWRALPKELRARLQA